jgi:hypothetical protein
LSSSIPAARLNLFNALTALTVPGEPLESWEVNFGPPEVHTEGRKVVALMGVESIATEHAALGVNQQEESYSILVRLKNWDPSCNGDPAELQAIDAEIWGAYETIRSTVAVDPTLGGAINISAIVATAGEGQGSGESPVPAVDENGQGVGWVSFADCRVLVRTRI